MRASLTGVDAGERNTRRPLSIRAGCELAGWHRDDRRTRVDRASPGTSRGPSGPISTALPRVITAEQPDVVVLQEARRPAGRTRSPPALGMDHIWNEKHHPFRPAAARSRRRGGDPVAARAARRPITVAISDVTSKRSYRRRIVQWAIVERADHSAYRVFNAHLSPHDMSRRAARRGATHRRARASRSATSPPTIVAGDLNDDGIPRDHRGAARGSRCSTPPPTNPSERPTQATRPRARPGRCDERARSRRRPVGRSGRRSPTTCR